MKTKEELKQVTGGVSVLDRYNIARPVFTPMGEMFKIDINNDFSTETTGYRQGGAMNETTQIPGLEAIGPYVMGGIPLDSDSELKK